MATLVPATQYKGFTDEYAFHALKREDVKDAFNIAVTQGTAYHKGDLICSFNPCRQ